MSSFLSNTIFFAPHHHHLILVPRSQRLSLCDQSEQQKDFMAQYLISSFDFSMERALKVSSSKPLSPIKNIDRPNSVVAFLKKVGLSDIQIKTLVSFEPNILSCNVEKSFEPRSQEILAAGFTREMLAHLIMSNPLSLIRRGTLSRLEFWRNFAGNDDEILLKIIQRNKLMMCRDIDTYIIPKIKNFEEYGLSQEDIVKLLVGGSRLMIKNKDSLRQVLERTKELGFQPRSNMFIYALQVLGSYKKESWDRKIEFYMKALGFSQEEVLCLFKKCPSVFTLSRENVEIKMEFLTKTAGIDPKSIFTHPILLSRSLDKCLAPRHVVLSILKEKGIDEKSSLCNVCKYSEKGFVERFVEPYKERLPKLASAYHAAYNGEEVSF